MKSTDRLDRLQIASPCSVGWQQMSGDDRTRFCKQCSLHVYNIEEMTRREVAFLIESTEGRICGRIYRRADGTIITKDCPVGLRAIRRRVARSAGAVFATVVSMCAMVMGQKPSAKVRTECQQEITISRKVSGLPTTSGVMAGIVSDQSGAVIPGARVTIIDPKTKETLATETNSEGHFMVAGIRPGSYQLTVSSSYFKDVVVKNVALAAGETVTFDQVVLSVVALTGDIIIVEPLPVDRLLGNRATFSGDLIRRLPLN